MRSLIPCLLAALAAANPPRKMTLAFSDDFDGTALDATKWAQAGYSPAGTVTLKDGKLTLGITKGQDGLWKGGVVTTRGKFEQAQGYYEASIKAGANQGHHLGFVLSPKDKKELYAEIYVAEAFGDDKVVGWVRYNDGTSLKDEKPNPPIAPFTGGAAGRDFHTYGVLCKAKELTWYIDGKEVFSTKKVGAKDPAFLTLVHTVSEFELAKLDPAKLPDGVQFDWVKVWK